MRRRGSPSPMTDDKMHPRGSLVYRNGRVQRGTVRVRPDDHGLLFGLGFFETFRTSEGRPHHWEWHRRRLSTACATAGIALPPKFLAADEARLRRVLQRLLEEQRLVDGVFRYTVAAGPPASGARDGGYHEPLELLTLRALPPECPPQGVVLRVLATRRDGGEWLPRPKSLNYANAMLGARELERREGMPADEGLFLSREGDWVVETARQNVAWMADDCLCYPEGALGAVAGTCLEWVLSQGVRAEPRRTGLEELLRADAILVCNAVRGVTPVCEVWSADDRTRLCSLRSHEHPVVRKLRAQWRESLQATAVEAP